MNIWAFPSFYPYDHPGLSYAGIFAHRQYKGLVENGARLNVIVPVPWNPPYPFSLLHKEWNKYRELSYPKERIYDGIKVYHPRIANFKPSRFVKKPYDERYVDAIINFFKDNKITLNPSTDIFYSQWLPNSMLVQQAAHKLGVRSAVLSIGDDVVLWPKVSEECYKQFEKTLTEADLRFACADYLGRLANHILGKNLAYDVIRMGAEYDFFRAVSPGEKKELRTQYHIPDDKTVILMIGTESVRKGWVDLFDALELIKKGNAGFVLAGIHTGEPDFDFKLELSKRGLEPFYHELGEVAPRSLNKIYNLADIFCLPSHSEGIANVVIEAMSSGLPVITTNVSGHPELVSDGITGILIPPHEPKILSEKLLELINNESLRIKLGASAREYVVNDWGNYAKNAKLLYEKLCAGMRKGEGK